MNTIETLKRCELFLGLDDKDIQKIIDLPSCQARAYDAQEIILETGEEAKLLYVLKEGQVSLIIRQRANSLEQPEQTILRTITTGGIFGWSALVPPHFRMGRATSKGPCEVVSISGDELRALFKKETRLGYEVFKALLSILASRIWNIEQLMLTGKRSPFI
ncbi:cyclic nucleotide-binding domain-containing protein [Chloroflexota bacterium]